MIAVGEVKWWSSSTVGANLGPVGLEMRARGGVGGCTWWIL